MFTGLVEEVGTIRSVASVGEGARVTIAASTVLGDVEMGASIAVNGCCLTVVEWGDDWWAADAVPETMDRTNLGGLAPGDPVNLERPLAANGRYGGHVVQGHVDGTGEVHSIEELDDGSWRFTFTLPSELANYVVEKGSIAVDGISLTVAAVTPSTFSIAIIPHTFAVTAMGQRNVGDTVNLEADVLAKYVERLVRPAP
ncbi:MAG TPA: riboflavin synthase [Acidimicrobiaceae bacterium]|nr:riboflavin synthase [Acidimicrobiaceae bacterium]HAI65702.1 riboflavin synthase [Acidimicrobiaceae bacterium]HBH75002.1 riboflavin synthase [Acidimicrobiaceae bacterium]|tara:strand:- start:715 stop:1311 length:597 start_codon:yes stop_codon:yes gene_type:complete